MNTFTFYQDRKVKVWERNYFSVEADTYEHAQEKLNKCIGEDITDVEIEDSAFTFINNEIVYDSLCYMTTEENEGNSTCEIYDNDTGELLVQNGKSYPFMQSTHNFAQDEKASNHTQFL